MRIWFSGRALITALILFSVVFWIGVGGGFAERQTLSSTQARSSCLSHVTIAAIEFKWNTTAVGPTCLTVNFTIVNTGVIPHGFTVSSLVNQTDPSTTDTSWFSAPNLLYDRPLNTTATLHATITFPKAGTYEFVCIPHYAVGMYGEIYVGVPVAVAFTPTLALLSPPDWYIDFALAGLAVLAVVWMVFGKQRILEALSDPTRRAIILALNERALPGPTLETSLRLPHSSLYRKLNELKSLGMIGVERVEITPEGKRVEMLRSLISQVTVEMDGEGLSVRATYRNMAQERARTIFNGMRGEAGQ